MIAIAGVYLVVVVIIVLSLALSSEHELTGPSTLFLLLTLVISGSLLAVNQIWH